MNAQTSIYPLRVFYDHSCPLCRAEMMALKTADIGSRLALVDCSKDRFEDAEACRAGIERSAMMRLLHVRDAQGRWLVGVPAFSVIYEAIGADGMARTLSHPLLRELWGAMYPWIAGNRQMLSRLGLSKAFDWWVRGVARRAARRVAACTENSCRAD